MKKLYLPKNFKFTSKPNAGFFDVNHYISESYNQGLFNFIPAVEVLTATANATFTLATEQYKSGTVFTVNNDGHTNEIFLDSSIPVGTTYTFVQSSASSSFKITPVSETETIYFTSSSTAAANAAADAADPVTTTGIGAMIQLIKLSTAIWIATAQRKVILVSED